MEQNINIVIKVLLQNYRLHIKPQITEIPEHKSSNNKKKSLKNATIINIVFQKQEQELNCVPSNVPIEGIKEDEEEKNIKIGPFDTQE